MSPSARSGVRPRTRPERPRAESEGAGELCAGQGRSGHGRGLTPATARSDALLADSGELVGEPVLVRVAGRLGAVLDAELAVDVRQVELHRLLGDPELLADRGVREAAGERA